MERKEATLSELVMQKARLDDKVSSAADVLKNIEDPAWRNRKGGRAEKLRLDVDPLTRFRNLTRPVSGIADMKLRLRDEILPRYQVFQNELDAQIEAVQKVQESEQPTKAESFTDEEAAMLGALILNKNGITVKLNDHGIFRFELDEKMVEVCQKLEQLPVSRPDYGKLTPEEYLKASRERFLQTLEDILQSENVDSIIGSQENDDVDWILMWLYYQNEERFFGLLPDFLKLAVTSRTMIAGRQGYVESFDRIWQPSAEILTKVRRKKEQLGQKEQVTDHEDQPADEEERQTISTSVDAGLVEVEVPPFEQPPLKPKTPDIERRDPEVRQKIRGYLDEILHQKNIRQPINSAQLTRAFQRLNTTNIDRMLERGYIRPEMRDGHPIFHPQEIARMLYFQDNQRIGFINRLVREIKDVTEQLWNEIEQEIAPGKEAKGNNNHK